jgi:hypothetical protein
MLEAGTEIRFVIVASTFVPNRNWFLVVTRDEFIIVRVSSYVRLRATRIEHRFPRTLLHARVTPTGRCAVTIGVVDYYVSRIQLREVRAQNDDFVRSARTQCVRPAVAHRETVDAPAPRPSPAPDRVATPRATNAAPDNRDAGARIPVTAPELRDEIADLRAFIRELEDHITTM